MNDPNSSLGEENPISRWEWLAILAATLLGAIPRFYQLGEIPFGLWMDEGLMGQGILQILGDGPRPIIFHNNGLPEEGLSYYITSLSVALFGQNTWAMRLPNALLGTLSIPLVWLCARRFVSPTTAVMAALYFAFFRWHFHFSRLGFRTLLAPIFSLLIFWSIAAFLQTKESISGNWWQNKRFRGAIAGLFLGLSLYTYTGMRLVVVGALVWLGLSLLLLYRQEKLAENAPIASGAQAYSLTRFTDQLKGTFTLLMVFLFVLIPFTVEVLIHPERFGSRQAQVSVLQEEGIRWDLVGKHTRDVALMGVFRGDDEIKHNIPGGPGFPQAYILSPETEKNLLEWQELRSTGEVPDYLRDPDGHGAPVFDLVTGMLYMIGLLVLFGKAFRTGGYLIPGLILWLLFGSANSVLSLGAPNQLRMLMVSPLACIILAMGLKSLGDVLKSRLHREHAVKILFSLLALHFCWFAVGESYRYFNVWANHPKTHQAFNADFRILADWLVEEQSEAPLVIAPDFLANFTSIDFLTRGVVALESDSKWKGREKELSLLPEGTCILVPAEQFPQLQVGFQPGEDWIPAGDFRWDQSDFVWLKAWVKRSE